MRWCSWIEEAIDANVPVCSSRSQGRQGEGRDVQVGFPTACLGFCSALMQQEVRSRCWEGKRHRANVQQQGTCFSSLLLPLEVWLLLQLWKWLCRPQTTALAQGTCIPLPYIMPASFAAKKTFKLPFARWRSGEVLILQPQPPETGAKREEGTAWTGLQIQAESMLLPWGKRPPLSPELRKMELEGTKRG